MRQEKTGLAELDLLLSSEVQTESERERGGNGKHMILFGYASGCVRFKGFK